MRISRRGFIALSQAGLMAAGGLFQARAAGLRTFDGKIRILVINPNSSQATTDMMVRIAQGVAPEGVEILGATAPNSPQMIVDPDALAASAPQVVQIGVARAKDVSGMIVSAFGDPGCTELRGRVDIPVVGIAESAMMAAAANGRRFGVATTTPKLMAAIDARAAELGLGKFYTGTRLTQEDPVKLVADPALLIAALRGAVETCIKDDKAEAVIIGGGPLGNAATALTPLFSIPIIAPIPAATRRILAT